MVVESDIIPVDITQPELNQAIDVAKRVSANLKDRSNLHGRDSLERFNNTLMGELAETMVLKWFRMNNKFAESTVDKTADAPDSGHDLRVKRQSNGEVVYCSVKSSLAFSRTPERFIEQDHLASTRKEVKEINIQVHFWLTLYPQGKVSRITVPCLRQSAIIGWFIGKNLTFTGKCYDHEGRERPDEFLKQGESMKSLLPFLQNKS
jgi:hypothetical protein